MDYISVIEYAAKFGISERTARNYCAEGKIEGAFLTGKTWNIPSDALIPQRKKRKTNVNPLLDVLCDQRKTQLKGGLYHRVQIDLAFNSNHIEGSRLTHDQTRYIYETNTIGFENEAVNVDDVVETVNHFRCFDLILDHCDGKLTEAFLKELHKMLKMGSSDSRKEWFRIGEYKMLPNEVGGEMTCRPEDVKAAMKKLLDDYNAKKVKTLDDILDFHVCFERIHPFQDGNGRVGRLIMFKECLANGIVPFIIIDELKFYYYRGLQNWPKISGYLRDTCLSAQDSFKLLLDAFQIDYR